jgi:hypothetical protein
MSNPAIEPAELTDPILIKRAKVAKWVSLGQKVGYGLYGICCVLFAYTVISTPTQWAVNTIAICFLIGSIILLPAIIFGYAVKSAARHDRELAQEAAAKKAAREKRNP